ncbi:EcsC family protein [Alicyclobacillus tolerans]|uniref:EcsC family protein n=1 Tax=Alicyclobacillus tolerans TaxID=90970 RepID=UPI001F234F5E|nr:EcsC family protein [Alicyclobacillus tolerans]MCF8564296.1 EcsC family protein [Alicyclobacillus tolerans]
MTIAYEDIQDLQEAIELLEHSTFVDRLTQLIGTPLDQALSRLPEKWVTKAGEVTRKSLKIALDYVLTTIDQEATGQRSRDFLHKSLAAASGALGGFFAPLSVGAAFAVEMPVATGIMMRSIADIAREQGEDLSTLSGRLACLEVLGLDTTHPAAMRQDLSAYYQLRFFMAGEVLAALESVTRYGVGAQSAPVIAQLLSRVAGRFELLVTEKLAAELIPVIGAAAGATLNVLFMDHYQRIARGHFILRRLERAYGTPAVRKYYEWHRQEIQFDAVVEPIPIR